MAKKNLYNVPPKQWRKWSDTAKRVFNDVYDFGMENKDLMLHPKNPKTNIKHHQTLCWNFAWIAADAVDDAIPEEIITN